MFGIVVKNMVCTYWVYMPVERIEVIMIAFTTHKVPSASVILWNSIITPITTMTRVIAPSAGVR